MSAADDEASVRAFNEAINARDPECLGLIMTDDHRFVDPAGAVVEGKTACLDAWRGFFASFPDYRNVFEQVTGDGQGGVEVVGRSECSDPRLAGPARWHAEVRLGRIATWQVSDA
jgi:ketosteroid isomerase-like protein